MDYIDERVTNLETLRANLISELKKVIDERRSNLDVTYSVQLSSIERELTGTTSILKLSIDHWKSVAWDRKRERNASSVS